MAAEDKFGVEISDEIAERINTVNDYAKYIVRNLWGVKMKKLIAIVLFLMLIASNANAGLFTFAQATSAKHRAQEAAQAIEETQEDIDELRKEVKELKDRVDKLIKLMEKQYENEKDDNNSKDS